MPKRLIVCADGTWNKVDQPTPSNVVRMSRAVLPTTSAPDGNGRVHQIVYYHPGVGTRSGLDRLTGGAFGHGLDKNIEAAYLFLMNNYEEGDKIFLFGFSRGAYTVRSLGGLLRNCGLLRKQHTDQFRPAMELYRRRDGHPNSDEAMQFRKDYAQEVDIHFLGVWDTVGSLGIPLQGLRCLTNRHYQFHDVSLSRKVHNAYQALAIDERRGAFEPSLWASEQKEGQTIEQVWFTGFHADVGGGNENNALADITFLWMKEKAQRCGLAFDEAYVEKAFRPNPLGPAHDSRRGIYKFTLSYKRPIGEQSGANQSVHAAAVHRFENDESYRPQNLVAYLQGPDPKIIGST
jgi:uncharacterized protein (DUF2235 family)